VPPYLGVPTPPTVTPLPVLVPEQQHFTPFIPTVYGNIDYREWQGQLMRIDEILSTGLVEESFQRLALANRNTQEQAEAEKETRLFRSLTTTEQESFQELSSQALRCNIARTLTGESYRRFACHLAESALLQWFCGMGRLDEIHLPGKSALQRYSEWIPEAEMRKVVDRLLTAATQFNPGKKQPDLELEEPLDLDAYFLDTTCVKLNIHFPVDWVLLRDAARTLMKATILIRDRGLKVRMEEPKEFLKRMNQLCIRMSHARRKKDSKRIRKAVLREMKKLSKVIEGHAQRQHDLLEKYWMETDLKEGEARQILGRIEVILERLPYAVKQAHERIIGERQVSNVEKILSLYEGHAAVYVRGKADAEVEFGLQLLLGECNSGVIVDWELVCGLPQADTKMLGRSLERLAEGEQDRTPRAIGGDRGFDSKANRGKLEVKGIFNGLCPRDPRDLKKRMEESEFVGLQQRRSQTEARISIFKNNFWGAPLKSKGYTNQNLEVAWSVLTHNLWVIARFPKRAMRVFSKAS
jgi:hypothetical protein